MQTGAFPERRKWADAVVDIGDFQIVYGKILHDAACGNRIGTGTALCLAQRLGNAGVGSFALLLVVIGSSHPAHAEIEFGRQRQRKERAAQRQRFRSGKR